ncbi:2-phospho-L-lactate guanylyltransferase [Rhodococcus opacus]|uniref:2-phospho-L-lactate guanylyltransferase n=1 Tax=Rhodococcus opacus TaxID=37919 RepID=UPI000FFCA286|nr:2-phospho-L-lactate guanylyltransferase [Rhodococcus opacus]
MNNDGEWAVIVPIRRLTEAKSRLAVPAHQLRSDFANAFLLDTIEAIRGSGQVRSIFVVSPDPSQLNLPGCHIERDEATGINDAVQIGRRAAVKGGHVGPVAAVLPDLPALRSRELALLLQLTRREQRAFVPDYSGTGTTVVTACTPETLDTSFGFDSAERHRNAGFCELDLLLPSIRRDVDTFADLTSAAILGLGGQTSQLIPNRKSLLFARQLTISRANHGEVRETACPIN